MREQIHAAKVESYAIVRSQPLKRGRLVCDAWSLRSFLKAVFKSAFVEATLSDLRQRFSRLVALLTSRGVLLPYLVGGCLLPSRPP